MTKPVARRAFIGDLPKHMKSLPVDERGYPVPKFVQYIDGKPDFRVMNTEHFTNCIRNSKCWICGEQLGRYKCYVIGPMCCINRISAEPPSHYSCAEFAARNCPFLSKPLAKRNERELPEHREVAGIMLPHNPGVTCLWVTDKVTPSRVPNGILFNIGEPQAFHFFTKGRAAYKQEIMAAIEKGLPTLQNVARQEGTAAMSELQVRIDEFMKLLNKDQRS